MKGADRDTRRREMKKQKGRREELRDQGTGKLSGKQRNGKWKRKTQDTDLSKEIREP